MWSPTGTCYVGVQQAADVDVIKFIVKWQLLVNRLFVENILRENLQIKAFEGKRYSNSHSIYINGKFSLRIGSIFFLIHVSSFSLFIQTFSNILIAYILLCNLCTIWSNSLRKLLQSSTVIIIVGKQSCTIRMKNSSKKFM